MQLNEAIPHVKAGKQRADRQTDGVSPMANYGAWRAARDASDAILRSQLLAAGASVKEDSQGATIKLAGIRSGSTIGLHQAVNNWLQRARARLLEEAGDAK